MSAFLPLNGGFGAVAMTGVGRVRALQGQRNSLTPGAQIHPVPRAKLKNKTKMFNPTDGRGRGESPRAARPPGRERSRARSIVSLGPC